MEGANKKEKELDERSFYSLHRMSNPTSAAPHRRYLQALWENSEVAASTIGRKQTVQ
jgi:hypothetical protein